VIDAADGASFCAVAPRTRPSPQAVRPSAEDEAEIRTALAELDRGEGVELTADELRRWAETGEWPERLD
jgi:hypothetical protein